MSPNEVLELGRAKARWAARPFQAYSFEYQVICACSHGNELTRITVNAGRVVGVLIVANDSAYGPEQWRYFPTIDTLFAEIRRYSHEDWQDVTAEYDPALGYPTLIGTFAHGGIADVGGTEYVRNLVPTP